MTFQLNVATVMTVVVPLLFLSLLGLASIARTFGYLRTPREKEVENWIKELHTWAEKCKDIGPMDVDLTPLINTVTQLSGLVAEVKTANDKIVSVATNQDFGLFALATGHRDLKKCCNETKEKVVEAKDKVLSIEGLIRKKATAGLLEQILVNVKDVKDVVVRHDTAVKYLEEAHPKAEFQKGERPAHWCSALALAEQLGQVTDKAAEAVEKVDKVLAQRYDMDKGSLDNTKTIVSLLANVLSGLETLKTDLKRMYDYIEPDEGDSDAKRKGT
jgi:hypothetical protein